MIIKVKNGRFDLAKAFHSVIEGIGNASQHKIPEKQLSEREYWRKLFIKRETFKNYVIDEVTGNTRIVQKVNRGRAK